MCKPQSQGGQRCAAHTRGPWEAAEAAYVDRPSARNALTLREARVEHASTPTGRRELEDRLTSVHPMSPEAEELNEALTRGALLREKNKAMADALVAAARPVIRRQDLQPKDWRPANNGTGPKPWFLIRDESIPLGDRYHENGHGNLIRYSSMEAAQRDADRLNPDHSTVVAPGTGPQPRDWRPASNGVGPKQWFLIRDEAVPLGERYHEDGNGNLIRYPTMEAAQQAAKGLNPDRSAPASEADSKPVAPKFVHPNPSMAAAARFLHEHDGRTFTTRQTSTRGAAPWEPGPRTLRVRGTRFQFDDSYFNAETGMKAVEITDRSITIDYPEDWGMQVTYTLVD
jgi:hypothetical protein